MKIISGLCLWLIFNVVCCSILFRPPTEEVPSGWRQYVLAVRVFGSLGLMLCRLATGREKEVELIDGTKTTKKKFEAGLWPPAVHSSSRVPSVTSTPLK